jgi:hypothetical protein
MESETLTPLQKAIELYEYYTEQLLIQHESAKLCAKKVCEEILNERITDRQREYWKWTLDEIKNIK